MYVPRLSHVTSHVTSGQTVTLRLYIYRYIVCVVVLDVRKENGEIDCSATMA